MPRKITPFASRLDKRQNGCWIWTGPLDSDGYGQCHDSETNVIKRAHRVSWALTKGKIPVGLCVLHKCDNPSCVNPSHLFLGTVGENNADRRRKGRSFKPFRNKRRHGIKDADLPWKVGVQCSL